MVLALLHAELVKHTNAAWVEHMSLVDLGFNSSMDHASGKSTFDVIFGYPVKIAVHLVLR